MWNQVIVATETQFWYRSRILFFWNFLFIRSKNRAGHLLQGTNPVLRFFLQLLYFEIEHDIYPDISYFKLSYVFWEHSDQNLPENWDG